MSFRWTLIQLFHQSLHWLFVFWLTSIAQWMSNVINLSSQLWIHHTLSSTLWSLHFLKIHITNVLSIKSEKHNLRPSGQRFLKEKQENILWRSNNAVLFYLFRSCMGMDIDWQVKKVAIGSVHWRWDQIKRTARTCWQWSVVLHEDLQGLTNPIQSHHCLVWLKF